MKISKTKRLALDAMLAAMFVVLSLFSINLPGMKITLDSLPILVGAACSSGFTQKSAAST